jgi:XapX domain-containing protein
VTALLSNFMLTIFMGLALGLTIGAGCRWFDIPSPSPPRIVGALLVLAMTLGYLTTDYVLPKKPEVTPALNTAGQKP